jgi:hypothetical protein
MIEAHDEDHREALFQFLSQNEDLDQHKITDEEKLQLLITELKQEFLKDQRNAEKKKSKREVEEYEDLRVKYPLYTKKIGEFATKYNQVNVGFRKLACMPTFMLGLVMASRVRRHYQHASWFRVATFHKMAEVHGAVSDNRVG